MNPTHSQYCHCECPETSAIKRVRELHKPFEGNFGEKLCEHCEVGQNSGWEYAEYPCATIKALDENDL